MRKDWVDTFVARHNARPQHFPDGCPVCHEESVSDTLVPAPSPGMFHFAARCRRRKLFLVFLLSDDGFISGVRGLYEEGSGRFVHSRCQ